MVFWIIIAGLALGVAAILGLTLIRGRVGDAPPAAYDLRVYRDQLKEVDRDLARGVISAEDAERVRTEVSRRVLSADAQLQAGGESGGQPRGVTAAMAGILAILVGGGALLLYSQLGAPGYPDLPLEARIAASDQARATRLDQAAAEDAANLPPAEVNPQATPEFMALMEKLRQTVESRPGDVQGLRLLARNEAALGNLAAAHKAQARLIEQLGAEATANDYALRADLMINAAAGYVSSDAEAVLRAALQRDPTQPTARYYLGLYLIQVDRPDGAFRTWEQLLQDSQPDAPWVPPIRTQLETVAQMAGVKYQLPPVETLAGPSAGDIEAAGDMSEQDQAEMIRGMVQRLSERLATDGGSPAEWARLIGAYGVLGETGRAAEIWSEAQQVFEGNSGALDEIRPAAVSAGVAE